MGGCPIPPPSRGGGFAGSLKSPPPPPPTLKHQGFSASLDKRHGRSSGMRHGWRSSWSGVRTPVRLSVQGSVGEAPATAPFSNPLHHRYRRCVGWRVSSSFLSSGGLSTGTQQKQSPSHNTPAAARSATGATCGAGTASPPHTPPQRGIEPSSSGQRPAALPLRYTTKSPRYAHLLTGTLCLNG